MRIVTPVCAGVVTTSSAANVVNAKVRNNLGLRRDLEDNAAQDGGGAMAVTRRRFLTQIGAAGGASLAYEAMTGLGLLAAPSQAAFDLTGKVSGVRVVILGAGLSGMTTSIRSAPHRGVEHQHPHAARRRDRAVQAPEHRWRQRFMESAEAAHDIARRKQR